ncbi:O-antigen ligase [Acidisphaera sp. L21]|uniref:O-antigen ligase family protein n=1 Tax=Acidisphaera sp. L21 TaxID=1641851 RepID=UPI00131E8EE0|nr:O-antigen ligase family protein [Acidisphaera sp. L21]
MNATPNSIPAWVNRLTIVVMSLMLLYAVVGIPEFNRDVLVATDNVNPLNRVIWLGLLGAAAPIALVRWRAVLELLASSWALLLLYAFFALSVGWALDPDASMRRIMFTIVQLLLAAVLLCGLRRASTLHILIACVCAMAAAEDLVAWALWPGYAMTDEGLAGLQLQKNQTGLLMMYGCLSATTGYFLVRGKWLRLMVAGSVVLMAGLLVATRSSTSQSIVLMAPVVIPMILLVSRLPAPAIWAVVAAIPAAITALFFGYLAWCGVTNYDPWLPLRGVTFTSRLDLWEFAVQEIAKRPWLGAGYSSFWAINPAVQPSLKSDMWFGTYAQINEAHQGYLDLLATCGVVGLMGGLFVVFRTLGIAGRAIVRAEPVDAADHAGRMAFPTAVFHMSLLVGLLVHNFTESNLFSNNSVLAVAFVLAALDLEKWRLAMRRPVTVRYPNPAPIRGSVPNAMRI